MKLRTRLAVAVVAAAIPLAGAVAWLRTDFERRRVAEVLQEFAVTRMEAGGRERCEADPASFPRPPRARASESAARDAGPPSPPPVPFDTGGALEPETPPAMDAPPPPLPEKQDRTRFWAYAADFVSANPDAPDLEDGLVERLQGGVDVALRAYDGPSGIGHEALVRMAWPDGPCAVVLVRRTAPRAASGGGRGWLPVVLVIVGVLVAVLLAFGPVVRRIRGLGDDVRRSAAVTYTSGVPVSGSDEITELAEAFNEAAAEVRARVDALHAREETLRRFVANTTHDLMTPLTVLQGHLSVLRGAGGDGADPGVRDAVRDALREVDYTTSLVNNLGTAAKLEADPEGLDRSPVVLNDLLDRVVARFRPVALASDVELNHAVPEEQVTIAGDVTLLEQAVGNVVQNAVRYNRPGGHVAVVLTREDGAFVVRVEDDGPGVADDELALLVERGRRGEGSRSRSPGGRGIGLDIARSVCARHGIDLGFARSSDGGLEVTLRGPLQA